MAGDDADEEYFNNYPDAKALCLPAMVHFKKYGARLGYTPPKKETQKVLEGHDFNCAPDCKDKTIAMCVHIYYIELVEEIAQVIENARALIEADVFLSLPNDWTQSAICYATDRLKPIQLIISENVGRDIWPFLQTLKFLRAGGYKLGCKIHSKKSPHLSNGDLWRKSLYASLLGVDAINDVLSHFQTDESVGILGPSGSKASCKNIDTISNNKRSLEIVAEKQNLMLSSAGDFTAGSMFWFRVKAFSSVADNSWHSSDFGPELGATDGTIAHAFERLFPLIAIQSHYDVGFYQSALGENPYGHVC